MAGHYEDSKVWTSPHHIAALPNRRRLPSWYKSLITALVLSDSLLRFCSRFCPPDNGIELPFVVKHPDRGSGHGFSRSFNQDFTLFQLAWSSAVQQGANLIG